MLNQGVAVHAPAERGHTRCRKARHAVTRRSPSRSAAERRDFPTSTRYCGLQEADLSRPSVQRAARGQEAKKLVYLCATDEEAMIRRRHGGHGSACVRRRSRTSRSSPTANRGLSPRQPRPAEGSSNGSRSQTSRRREGRHGEIPHASADMNVTPLIDRRPARAPDHLHGRAAPHAARRGREPAARDRAEQAQQNNR